MNAAANITFANLTETSRTPEGRALPKIAARTWMSVAVAGDALAAVGAALMAYWLRFCASPYMLLGRVDELTLRQYAAYILVGSATLMLTLAWSGIYRRSSLLRVRWVESRICRNVLVWTAGFLFFVTILRLQPGISRIYLALNAACAVLFLLSWRAVFNAILSRPAIRRTVTQRTVFLGWNEACARLNSQECPVYDVVGWVDAGLAAAHCEDTPAPLGQMTDLEAIITREGVEMVILSDIGISREQLISIVNLCEREMVSFKIIPTCFQIFTSGLSLETVAGTPVLGVDRLKLDNLFNAALKRTVDIIGATIGLVLSAPLIALFGALVWAESKGSIIYSQIRTGVSGRNFRIFKIRSMKLDAEANGKAGWSTQNDPRRLRVGAFMRRWNIDELPQFWNVLKGDMSLVGPRPERPELINGFKHEIPHYNARHAARPGITGWAQINGLRGDTDLTARIQCDIWYLENWSLLLDFQIMLQTFFKREGAC